MLEIPTFTLRGSLDIVLPSTFCCYKQGTAFRTANGTAPLAPFVLVVPSLSLKSPGSWLDRSWPIISGLVDGCMSNMQRVDLTPSTVNPRRNRFRLIQRVGNHPERRGTMTCPDETGFVCVELVHFSP